MARPLAEPETPGSWLAGSPRVPFGGAKQSGYSLEFGVEGLKAAGVPQVING